MVFQHQCCAVLSHGTVYPLLLLLLPSCSPLASLLNLIIPTWPLAKTPKNTMFPDLQADFDSDLCTYKYDTRIRVGVECLRACDSLMANMQKLELPLLVFHSTADTLTDPDGSKLLVSTVKVRGGSFGEGRTCCAVLLLLSALAILACLWYALGTAFPQ